METNKIASFVVRFQLAVTGEEIAEGNWRIKVTNVQTEEESLFTSPEEAIFYMKRQAEDS